MQIGVSRLKVCIDCNGKGGENVAKCSSCDGNGAVVKMVQVGPGMYAQSQAKCEDCEGAGEKIPVDSLCQTCKGKKRVEKTEEVEVTIPVGAPDDHQILIPEKGDEHPVYKTGDLVVILAIQPHETLKRIKNDLYIVKRISLIEALGGFKLAVSVFKAEVVVSCEKVCSVNHKDVKVLKGMGMPHFKDDKQRGSLLVEFLVEMPASLSTADLEILRSVLPKPILPPITSTAEVREFSEDLGEIDEDKEEQEEDEHTPGGQRVECQQQ